MEEKKLNNRNYPYLERNSIIEGDKVLLTSRYGCFHDFISYVFKGNKGLFKVKYDSVFEAF